MVANKTYQTLRRQFLTHAHDTDLWATHVPHLPNWLYLLAVLGVGLIIVALTIVPSTQVGSRIFVIACGVLLCLPLLILTIVMRQLWQRRAAVRKQILDAVPWRGDEAVLDVGCGSGMLLNGAAARLESGTALGIDIWAEHGGGGSLDLLTKNAEAEGVADRIQFQEVDARNMPFDDASFDVVLASWSMHHISRSREDFDNAAHQMIRVLKPGGTIVVLDIPHMIEALTLRLQKANFQVELQDATMAQKMVVGKKI
ncbi:MAG: class I SAM-dependent methyltransferase [Chloroflexi bacterium]|nr:class I SAM-dependent methyltransferase [Chloroflexota bacterium]